MHSVPLSKSTTSMKSAFVNFRKVLAANFMSKETPIKLFLSLYIHIFLPLMHPKYNIVSPRAIPIMHKRKTSISLVMEGYTIILYKTVLSKQKIQKNEREVHLVI